MDMDEPPLGIDLAQNDLTEEALRVFYEASSILMGAVELLPDGDLLHLYDNPCTSHFFGIAPGATAGRSARSLGIPESTITLWRARYEEAIALGRKVTFCYEHDRGNGAPKLALAVTVTPLASPGTRGGRACCYVAEEISPQRRVQTVMQKAINSTSDAVFVLSADWRFELVNATTIAMIADGRDLNGQNIWEVYPEAVGGTFWHAYRRCMSERIPVEVEEYYAPLGRTFAARAFPSDGNSITVFLQDVSERRESEDRLRKSEATLSAVLDALPVGVVIADAAGRLLRDNAAHRQIWGIPPIRSGREQYDDYEGYFPETGRRISAQEWAMSRALLQGEVVRGELVECQPFDASPRRFYLNNAAPVRDASGRIVAGVVVELDVTEQRRAQEALARSTEDARLAAERVQLALDAGAIAGTWDWDPVNDRFTVDERFAENFGIEPALGRTELNLEQVIATVHPDDLPGLRAAIEEAMIRGGPYSREYRVRGRDGIYRWIEANGRVDHGADGTPIRFPGVLLDLQRRRAVEAERDRAMQLLRAFIDAVPGVVYAKDRDGRMLMGNRGLSELVGKPPEVYLGKTDIEFLDHKDQAAAVMETDRRIMESALPETVEEEVSFPDGRKALWLSTKAPFLDSEGRVIGLIGSSVDITARKHAEIALRERSEEVARTQMRLQLALTAGKMGVWEWTPGSGEAIWTPQMFEILGLPASSDGRVSIDIFMNMVQPEDRVAVEAALTRSLRDGSEYEAEMRVVRADGAVRWLLGRGHVVREPHESAARLVGVNVDITERKEVEQALVEADKRRNEFLAMLGHELRNPLAPISTAVQLLQIAGDQKERRDAAIQIIGRQADHMARLVDDLLEVSRVTQGRIELRKENFPVASAVFSAVETVRPLALQREQTLDVKVPCNIDLVADQARVIQVVANLLNNASKYTQRGGHISVRADVAGERNDCVEIVVSDNGPGIEESLLPRIFDLFSQGATTLDRARGGLGLGLALTRRLVELHGGEVTAFSAGPGKGSRFTVRLPRMEQRQAPREAAVAIPFRAVAPTTFLVVDDNLDATEMLATLLRADGHRVECACDGEEALAMAQDLSPRVVLLDLGLPRIDGWEVARRLRSNPLTAKALLIALSGYGQASDRQHSKACGIDAHLLKPASLTAIYNAVTASEAIHTGFR